MAVAARPSVAASLMFEAYINALRMRRMQVHDLTALAFRHLRTVCVESASDRVGLTGWAKWAADADGSPVGLVWPWAEIQHGGIALDPSRIQSNLLLVCPRGEPLGAREATSAIIRLVHALEWQAFARSAALRVARRRGRPRAAGRDLT